MTSEAERCGEALTGSGGASEWCQRGSYFAWSSTTTPDEELDVFWGCAGDAANPAVLLVHGWPTSSIDYADVVDELAADHRVCWLDTPGYGFSDKPANYTYSIFEDAQIVEHFARDVAGLASFALVTHDKGDSVGLELLRRVQLAEAGGGDPGFEITQHVVLNGNVYLPLANLSSLQLSLLDPETGSAYADSLTPAQLSFSLGIATYSPALGTKAMRELAATFAYQDGTSVMDSTVQYLNERSEWETVWLDALAASRVPLHIFWGEEDAIAPTAVADFVWEEYAKDRAAPARYWRHPCANHYIETDHATDVATLIRAAVAGSEPPFAAGECAPYEVR